MSNANHEHEQKSDGEKARRAFLLLDPEERARSIMDETSMIGGYELMEKIGEGGFGVVYRAHKNGLGDVAIKVFKTHIDDETDPRYQAFAKEAQALIQLENVRNVVRGRDFGLYDDSLPYLVTSFFQGDDLRQWLKPIGNDWKNRLTPVDVRRIMLGALTALADVFEQTAKEVIHRDLTPGNIIVKNVHQENAEVRVLDWGIARLRVASNASTAQPGSVTQALMAAQTPDRYASPEMLLRQPLTPASDCFQLALVAYELLTGKEYWKDGWIASAMPSRKWGIRRALRKALEWSPSRRFSSASRFRFAVQHPILSWFRDYWRAWIVAFGGGALIVAVMSLLVTQLVTQLGHKDLQLTKNAKDIESLETKNKDLKREYNKLLEAKTGAGNERAEFEDCRGEYKSFLTGPNEVTRKAALNQCAKFIREWPNGNAGRQGLVNNWKNWLDTVKAPWRLRLTVDMLEAYDGILGSGWYHEKDVKLTIGVKQNGDWKKGMPKERVGKAGPSFALPQYLQLVKLNCTYGDTICIYYSVDGDREFTREFELLRGKPGWDDLRKLKAQSETQDSWVYDNKDYKFRCQLQVPEEFQAPPELE